jgi:hypothetical protein
LTIQIIQVAGFCLLIAINQVGYDSFQFYNLGQALLSLGCLSLIDTAETMAEKIGGLGFGSSFGNANNFGGAWRAGRGAYNFASKGLAVASKGTSTAVSSAKNLIRR